MIILKKLLIPIVLAFVAFVAFSCTELKPIELKEIKNVSINSIDEKEMIIDLGFVIANPNNRQFSVREAELTISLGGIPLGSVNEIKSFNIPSHSSKSYNIPIKVDIENMGENAKQLTKSVFRRGTSLRIQGYIKARGFLISRKIEIDEEAKLSLLKSLFG
ncbi:MAG: LEA type 2 family protein [Bacteroidota bacterium]|nr:LEA type 2 family protein [Bacteroidota bacterium]